MEMHALEESRGHYIHNAAVKTAINVTIRKFL
jgi:hypothetical protein